MVNFFSDQSELSVLTERWSREVSVSPETLDIIEKAIYVSEKSGGLSTLL